MAKYLQTALNQLQVNQFLLKSTKKIKKLAVKNTRSSKLGTNLGKNRPICSPNRPNWQNLREISVKTQKLQRLAKKMAIRTDCTADLYGLAAKLNFPYVANQFRTDELICTTQLNFWATELNCRIAEKRLLCKNPYGFFRVVWSSKIDGCCC